MSVMDDLERATQEAIAERGRLKDERSAGHQAAQELKGVLAALRAERADLADGLTGLVEAAVQERVDVVVARIVDEHGRALRKALHDVEEALRGLT